MEKSDHELLVEIHDKVCDMPDRRDLGRAKREIIRCYYRERKSEVDQNGPSSLVRQRQVQEVRRILHEAYLKKESLSLHMATLKAWEPIKDGYPTPKALYEYCHEHENEF